ncbi:unnamed protein product, partial [Polarella glacialis]
QQQQQQQQQQQDILAHRAQQLCRPGFSPPWNNNHNNHPWNGSSTSDSGQAAQQSLTPQELQRPFFPDTRRHIFVESRVTRWQSFETVVFELPSCESRRLACLREGFPDLAFGLPPPAAAQRLLVLSRETLPPAEGFEEGTPKSAHHVLSSSAFGACPIKLQQEDSYDCAPGHEDDEQRLQNGGAPPSMGSESHGSGRCKPCAFLHTKGCENGLNCEFCHLCEAGEKKKRRKDKIDAQKHFRQQRHVTGYLF